MADPVGATEVAVRCGVDLGTVKKWQQRHRDFPQPRRLVGGRPAWDWALDIAPWLADTGRPVPDVTIQPWTKEPTMLTTTIALGAEYSTSGQMDGISAYLGDGTYTAAEKETIAAALLDAMRDEVDERLPEGWSWQPGASEIIAPAGYEPLEDGELDEILEAAWAAVAERLQEIEAQVLDS